MSARCSMPGAPICKRCSSGDDINKPSSANDEQKQ
jgi:hypothetical protein